LNLQEKRDTQKGKKYNFQKSHIARENIKMTH